MRIRRPARIVLPCAAGLVLSALVGWLNFAGNARLYVTWSMMRTELAPVRLVQTMGWPLRMYEFEEWSHGVNKKRSDDEVTEEVPISRYGEMYDKVPCCVSGSDERWLPLGVAANVLVALALAIGAPSLLAWMLGKWAREPTP